MSAPAVVSLGQPSISKRRRTLMRRHVSGLTILLVAVWTAVALGQRAPQSRSFQSDGVKIHFTDQGSGEPVVVLHGYAMSIARMESAGIVSALANAGYRVLAVDARGHGESDKPHDPAAYGPQMARDVVRLLDS